jgi:DNA-binding response OmpR family regulator
MITKILKTNRETKTIPIVMISASQEVDKIAKVAGADDYLSKPFNIDELNSMVKKYLAFV